MTITYEDIKRANEAIKTTDIKGKEYAEVNQRIKAFRMVYPTGQIQTEIVSNEGGVCVIRAAVGYVNENGHGVVLGTGTAYEKENSSFINKTSYIENCVPLDTEILTKEGWKYYYQVKLGDEVLSVNMDSKQVEFCKLLSVNVHKDRPLVKLETNRFKVVCTPQHKWIVRSQYKGLRKQATEDLKASEKIVQNIKQDVNTSIIGRKLGWLMCDCEISRTQNGMPGNACVNQSKYLDDIKELFGEGTQTKKYKETWKDNYRWYISADDVRDILGRFDIKDYSDLSKAMLHAPLDDVAGCYRSMVLADGESRGFTSTYIELVEAVQIMCARLGIATGKIKARRMKNSTKPIYTLSIKKTDGAYVSEIRVTNVPPRDVWCPTTENGTWFMRQGTFVTATSNCETSAVGRALGMAGFGIDTSVASAEEVQNAIANQDTPIEPTWTKCSQCGNVITARGKWSAEQIADMNYQRFGRVLCADCGSAENKKQSGDKT